MVGHHHLDRDASDARVFRAVIINLGEALR